MPRPQSPSMLFQGTWSTHIRDNHFPNVNQIKEKVGNVAYSYSTMLVSSNLRFPHDSHIKTQAPFPCSGSCHAEQTQGRLQLLRENKKERKKQHEASSPGARLNWLHQLTIYLGSTLLWTRLCLLGGAICTRAGEKERDIENMETNVRGKIHGGKKNESSSS